MAYLALCGAECRSLDMPTTGADVRHPVKCLNLAEISVITSGLSGAGGSAAYRVSSSTAITWFGIAKALAAGTKQLAGHFRFRINTVAPSAVAQIMQISAAATNLRVETSGALTIRCNNSATTTVLAAGVMAANTWYYVEWKEDQSANPWVLTVRVDNGADFTASSATVATDITTVAGDAVRLGLTTTVPTSAVTVDIDDVGVADFADYPFGNRHVSSIIPDADGTHSFTAGDFGYSTAGADIATSATDVYTYVDDGDVMSTTELVRQKVIRTTGYLEVDMATSAETTAPYCAAVVSGLNSSAATANTQKTALNDGGTISDAYALTTVGTATTNRVHGGYFPTAPSTGTAWTLAKFNALKVRWGYSGDITPNPYWAAVVVEGVFADAVAATQVLYTNPYPPIIAQ